MSFYNSTKSILYKRKYYSISFKLSFITKFNLKYKKEGVICSKLNEKLNISNDILITDRFNFRKIIHSTTYGYTYYLFLKKHRDNKPASVVKKDNVLQLSFYQNDKIHRDNKPAYIEYVDEVLFIKSYYENGVMRDGFSHFVYYPNGNVKSRICYLNDKIHNDNGPAKIQYYENGVVYCIQYFKYGFYCNTGPIIITFYPNGHVKSKDYNRTDNKYIGHIEYYENGNVKIEDNKYGYDSISTKYDINGNKIVERFSHNTFVKYVNDQVKYITEQEYNKLFYRD